MTTNTDIEWEKVLYRKVKYRIVSFKIHDMYKIGSIATWTPLCKESSLFIIEISEADSWI